MVNEFQYLITHEIIDGLLGVVVAGVGWLVKDLKADLRHHTEALNRLTEVLARDYVPRKEFEEEAQRHWTGLRDANGRIDRIVERNRQHDD